MRDLNWRIKNSIIEPPIQKYYSYDPPKYPQPWIGERYFTIWRSLIYHRGTRKHILKYDVIKRILRDDDPQLVRQFIQKAILFGLFIKIRHGIYFILPPNRAFNALSLGSQYVAQVYRLSSMFRILKLHHVFICTGINYYSQMNFNIIHLGLPDTEKLELKVGGTPINIWRLDRLFFDNVVQIQGPRYTYLKFTIPSVEDTLLLTAYTRLPRFEMAFKNILKKHDFDANYVLASAPSLQLGKRFRTLIEEKKGFSKSDDQPLLYRHIDLPSKILEQQKELLQLNVWD